MSTEIKPRQEPICPNCQRSEGRHFPTCPRAPRVREGCRTCGGTGVVLEGSLLGGKVTEERCSTCGGEG